MLRAYERGLDHALGHRFITLLVFLTCVGLTGYFFTLVPSGFFPQQDTGLIFGQVIAGQDVSTGQMQSYMARFAGIVSKDPAVAHFAASTGGNRRILIYEVSDQRTDSFSLGPLVYDSGLLSGVLASIGAKLVTPSQFSMGPGLYVMIEAIGAFTGTLTYTCLNGAFKNGAGISYNQSTPGFEYCQETYISADLTGTPSNPGTTLSLTSTQGVFATTAGHDQFDVIALSLHFYASAFHAAPQLGLLTISIIAIAGTRRAGEHCADGRALATVVMADRCANSSTGKRRQAAVGRGTVTAAAGRPTASIVIRIVGGTANQQSERSGTGKRT
jgi:hypothetical protein